MFIEAKRPAMQAKRDPAPRTVGDRADLLRAQRYVRLVAASTETLGDLPREMIVVDDGQPRLHLAGGSEDRQARSSRALPPADWTTW